MNKNKYKIFMILSILVLVVTIIVSSTYAWYIWTTDDSNVTKIVAGIGTATVTFDGGGDINADLRPVPDKSEGISKTIKVKADTTGLVFNLYLDITNIDTNLKHESFKYELYKGTTKVKEGNFSDTYLNSNTSACTTNNTTHITLLTNESISTSNTNYKLYIWIDGANYTNPDTMMDKTFSFKLHADGEGAVVKKPPTVADTIIELYNSSTKTSVTNNGITYQYDTTNNLMKDAAGNIRYYGASNTEKMSAWQSKGTSALSQLYLERDFTSEEDCTSSILGLCTVNYKELGFASIEDCKTGSSQELKGITGYKTIKEVQDNYCTNTVYPLNNYIYFNCSDYSNQSSSTCETWRIIGVFDGKVKIMRNESIESYSWDNKDTSTGAESAYGKNDWTTARLMKLLNPSDYYAVDANDNGYGQSLYYNAQSGTCFSGQYNVTTSCNFTSTGIKNDTTRNMIAEVTWNLGGWGSDSVYSNQMYTYERGTTVYKGRPTTWTGKIALAYPSDYGYAADLSKCTKQLGSYYYITCAANNWMKSILGTSNYGWLLTPNSGNACNVWNVSSLGSVYYSLNAYNEYGAAPVLYLSSELVIESGDGTSSNPYKLSA